MNKLYIYIKSHQPWITNINENRVWKTYLVKMETRIFFYFFFYIIFHEISCDSQIVLPLAVGGKSMEKSPYMCVWSVWSITNFEPSHDRSYAVRNYNSNSRNATNFIHFSNSFLLMFSMNFLNSISIFHF